MTRKVKKLNKFKACAYRFVKPQIFEKEDFDWKSNKE